MNKKTLTIIFAASFVFVAACKKKSTTPANTSPVMFVNGCTNSTNVDFLINNTKVPNATTIAFLKNSGYQNVNSGAPAVGVELSAQQGSTVTTSYNFTTGSRYSVFAAGIVGINSSASVLVTPDDLTAPASGYAKVRLVNLSSDTLNENLYINGSNTPVATGITAKSAGSFYQVPAAQSTTILASDPSQPARPIQPLSSQVLASGKIYTFIITGTYQIASGTPGSLTLSMINNN